MAFALSLSCWPAIAIPGLRGRLIMFKPSTAASRLVMLMSKAQHPMACSQAEKLHAASELGSHGHGIAILPA